MRVCLLSGGRLSIVVPCTITIIDLSQTGQVNPLLDILLSLLFSIRPTPSDRKTRDTLIMLVEISSCDISQKQFLAIFNFKLAEIPGLQLYNGLV